MLAFVRVFYLLFGILSIAGGVLGFVKAKSRASLLAGGVSGVLLLVAAFLMGGADARWGMVLGFVLSIALAGRFVPSFVKTKKAMPAGMMALLSLIGIAVTALLWMGR